jgi:hypothetical protein
MLHVVVDIGLHGGVSTQKRRMRIWDGQDIFWLYGS